MTREKATLREWWLGSVKSSERDESIISEDFAFGSLVAGLLMAFSVGLCFIHVAVWL